MSRPLRPGIAGPRSAAARGALDSSSTTRCRRASAQSSGSRDSISRHWSTSVTAGSIDFAAVAKVEKRTPTLTNERQRELLREMLLLRRVEAEVEERFRAGDLAGLLHV